MTKVNTWPLTHSRVNPKPLIGQSPSVDSQCPVCLQQAVVTLWLPCTIVESLWHHIHVPFVNIASLHSWSTKCLQWKHKLDYNGIVFADLAAGCGINAKDPSGLDSDRWIPHSRHCENSAQLKPMRDSCTTSQWDSLISIQPQGVFHYKSKVFLTRIKHFSYEINVIAWANLHITVRHKSHKHWKQFHPI